MKQPHTLFIALGFCWFCAPSWGLPPVPTPKPSPSPVATPKPAVQSQAQPTPAPSPNTLSQVVNDSRLKLFDWIRTKPWINPPVTTVSQPTGGVPGASPNPSASGAPDPNAAANATANAIAALGKNTGGGNGNGSGNRTGGAGNGAGASGGAGGPGAGAGGGDTGGPIEDPTENLPTPPGRVIAGGGGRAQAFSLWYPMCLFIDPTAQGQAGANAAVKGLVDDAAACQVNLVVFPITVRPGSYPLGDPEGTNAMQTAACNIAGRLDNASRASTSICVNHDQMADKMCVQLCNPRATPSDCGPDGIHKVNTAGCAQVNSDPSEASAVEAYKAMLRASRRSEDQARLAEIEEHMKGGASSSPIAPSIEDKGACDSGTVGHEALGHSMFGHPNGASDGHGIGLAKTGGGGGGWTPEGCAAMRRNAFPNSGKWRYDASRTSYYREVKNPAYQWDLSSGRKLLGPNRGVPPGGPARVADTGGGDTGRVVFDDNATKDRGTPQAQSNQPKPSTPPGAPGTPEVAAVGPDGRHKGGSAADALLEGLQDFVDQGADLPPPNNVYVKGPPSAPPGKTSTARVEFDDSAKKGGSTSFTDYGVPGRVGSGGNGGTVGFTRNPASTGGGSGGRTSVTFDDSAKKGGGSQSYTDYGGGSGAGAGGGGGGATATASSGGGGPNGSAGGAGSSLDGNFFNVIEKGEDEREAQERAKSRRPATIVEGAPGAREGTRRAVTR